VLLRLGDRFIISDQTENLQPGRAYDTPGWGIPNWGPARAQRGFAGPMKPSKPIGARYFCGDCSSVKENKPVAIGHKFGVQRAAYQDAITAHMTENHKDLHYPIPQDLIDAHEKAKRKAKTKVLLWKQLQEVGVKLTAKERDAITAFDNPNGNVGGGLDMSGSYQPVSRPRELPDFTEFDFPDANVADAGVEELELDQLISIQARMGRRLLGVELQNLDIEAATEYLTIASGVDHEITDLLELNTRTGGFNLDDPENLWRIRHSLVVSIGAATEVANAEIFGENDIQPGGGVVYVAPRLFFRFSNAMDRQVDTGDLMTRIATIDQPLSTFLLFELLEQFSGLFGLT